MMRRYLRAIVVALLLSAIFLSPSTAEPIALPDKSASWLEILNYYRLSSGLSPVEEDPKMTEGAQNHANYLAKTNNSFEVGEYQNLHKENPASPYFTQAGVELGAGNVSWSSASAVNRSIDDLMTAPFHAIGFLREGLSKVGYGTATVQSGGHNPGSQVTDVAIIAGTTSQPRTKILLFPGSDATVYLGDFSGENPDPRESCGRDFKSFRGLPIFASLLTKPQPNLSVTVGMPNGQTVSEGSQLCVVSENNFISSDSIYGDAGKSIIAAEHLVLIIPRNPLAFGTYSVTIKQGDLPDIAWKFKYADFKPKFSSSIKVSYPRSSQIAYVGEQVKFQVYNVVSVFAETLGNCRAKWDNLILTVIGTRAGKCSLTIKAKPSLYFDGINSKYDLLFKLKK